MSRDFRSATIALAGIYQAAQMVRDIAWNGQCNSAARDASLASLLVLESNRIEDIFGGLGGISTGLKTLSRQLQFGTMDKRQVDVTRYVINLITLEREFSRHPGLSGQIAETLGSIKDQSGMEQISSTATVATLSQLYKSTLSEIQPRIMVQGTHAILSEADNANLIRALLLAGIRSAVLWQQVGGTRWSLLWHRKRYLQEAEILLRQIYG